MKVDVIAEIIATVSDCVVKILKAVDEGRDD